MKYESEKDIFEVIENFKNCNIKRGTWGHPEHLIVAYHLASNHGFEDALKEMRDGIFRLLESFEIDPTEEMSYHETMTVFWMRTVYDFVQNKKDDPIVKTINELITKFDKEYPLRFYTNEVLFSDEARKTFVEADLDDGNPKNST